MKWIKSFFISLVPLVSLFLLFDISLAQENWHKFSYFQNWGGLNDQLSTTEIQDNEATDLQNVVFDTGGAIAKRFGFDTVPNNPTAKVATGSVVAPTGLAFYKTSAGNKYLVALVNNDGKATLMKKSYLSTGGLDMTTGWDNIDFISLPSNYTNNNLPVFTVGQDKLIFTVPATTSNKPFVWEGAGNASFLTSDPNCPTATISQYHKQHLFLNDTTNLSRIRFSNINDVTTYTATDFIDLETNDGTQVRAFVSAFDSLYIFKDKSIWRLSGQDRDSWKLEKMVTGIGTLSPQSIAVVNNYIYFTTAQNDVGVYDGAYAVNFISKKIRNTIGNSNFSRVNTNLGLAFSTYKYNDFDYYASISASSSSSNDQVLLFDTAFNAWSKFQGINANAWCVADDSNAKNALFFGDYSGYVNKYPNNLYYDGNIATNAINAYYQTKWFKFSDVALGDKYWRRLWTYTLAEPNTTYLLIECKADQESSGKIFSLNISNSGGAQWDVAVWDVDLWGGSSIVINKTEVEKGTTMFQLKFSNSDVSLGFTILGWEMFIEASDRV